MAETNINAYKAELVVAEKELARAEARVNSLKSFIESVEPTPKVVVESAPVEAEAVEVKITKKKGKK